MMALAGVELETLVSEPDALTTRPLHFLFVRVHCFTTFLLTFNPLFYNIVFSTG